MFLSNFSVKKPIATIVLILGMMCMGLLALSKLRVNQNPDVDIPVIVVSIPYPGASPETSEREIINRLEKQMLSVPGVTEVESEAREGSAVLIMQFDFKRNLIEASDDVRNAISAVRYKLPTEMREPILRRIDPASQPIMQLALSSTAQSHAELSRLAEDVLADRFRAIEGVSTVNVNGSLRRELSVLLRADKLREYNVSVSEVSNALRNQNTNAPVGKVRGEMDEKGIRLIGRIERPEDFSQVVVKRMGDTIVRLNQVAEIRDGFADIDSASIHSGAPNVGISVVRTRDASTVSIAKEVRKLVEEINKELPKGSSLAITRDGGSEAQSSLNNVIESLVFGAVLTVFVVYAFLNSWRSTLITALSLPTSVLAACRWRSAC
jgi:multidrug efflux pump subunit AcrB